MDASASATVPSANLRAQRRWNQVRDLGHGPVDRGTHRAPERLPPNTWDLRVAGLDRPQAHPTQATRDGRSSPCHGSREHVQRREPSRPSDEAFAEPRRRAKPDQLELAIAVLLGWCDLRLQAGLEPHVTPARKGSSPSHDPLDHHVVAVLQRMDRRRPTLVVVAPRQQPQEIPYGLVPATPQMPAGGGPDSRQRFDRMIEQCRHRCSSPGNDFPVNPSERR